MVTEHNLETPAQAKPKPASRYERLSFRMEVHEAGEDGTFTGLASAFDTLVDTFPPTRFVKGAFRKTLRENRDRIKVLWQHNPDWPIGVPLAMKETEEGLEVKAQITTSTQMGREALALMREGIITELSIGFDALKFDFIDEGKLGMIRHIKEARLWEFSPVTFAANSAAIIRNVNRAEMLDDDGCGKLESAEGDYNSHRGGNPPPPNPKQGEGEPPEETESLSESDPDGQLAEPLREVRSAALTRHAEWAIAAASFGQLGEFKLTSNTEDK